MWSRTFEVSPIRRISRLSNRRASFSSFSFFAVPNPATFVKIVSHPREIIATSVA
jgi:hypothetical protein